MQIAAVLGAESLLLHFQALFWSPAAILQPGHTSEAASEPGGTSQRGHDRQWTRNRAIVG